jgi:hypothetical protein
VILAGTAARDVRQTGLRPQPSVDELERFEMRTRRRRMPELVVGQSACTDAFALKFRRRMAAMNRKPVGLVDCHALT